MKPTVESTWVVNPRSKCVCFICKERRAEGGVYKIESIESNYIRARNSITNKVFVESYEAFIEYFIPSPYVDGEEII